MGGFGSGQRYWGAKGTVESYCRVDVRYLQKSGYFDYGGLRTLAWRDGEGNPRGSIRLVASQEQVQLFYRVRRNGEEWKDIEETVPVVWTPCHYGGIRPWFLCPGTVNGRTCWRRVAILYDAGYYFLCRHCYHLAYESQNEDLFSRRMRKAGRSVSV